MKSITPSEYLEREETAEFRSEYHQGEVFAMAGESINHNRIVKNCISHFETGLDNKKCEAFSENVRLWIKASGMFTYPDLAIVCGQPEFYEDRDDTIKNPVVIIEVLSKTTETHNRVGKFKFYRSIPTLQEYVLIDQYSVHIEQYYRETPRKWALVEYDKLAEVLKFAKIDFQISLEDIYHRVKLTKG